MAADVTGIKFQDLTGDGFSADDTPLAGVTIQLFQDNGDGTFDPNVDTLVGSQATGANGVYNFPQVADGSYFVRELVPAGFYQTGGPAFYNVLVQGNNAFTLNGVGIDNFSQPDPADVYFINALDPDPTLIKHDVAGVIGGQRDALIDVLGTSNPLSANVVVGFNGIAGLFSFGSAAPGTSATLQYDGVDADIVGPPASLVNAQGLSQDITNGGLATGFLFDFASIDPGLGTALGVQIRLTSTGGGTATFTDTTTFLESITAVNHFVPFASFATAGGFTFEDVTSIEIVFNSAGVQDVDFEVDQILTAGTQGNFANAAFSSLSGFVYVDANNNGIKEPGEAPIPNTTVTLTGTDNLGQAVNIVDQTDANGQYLFENLRPGTYTITETQPAGFLDGKDTVGTPGGTTGQDIFSNIVLPVGFAGVNNNFGELLASSIGGFVYVDANNNGIKEPGEAPIPNVTVTLTGTDDLGQAVNVVDQTDAAGAYLFENLRPGTYTITETQPAGFLDGKDTIGTPGGTTGQDVFSNIVLPQDFDGVNNNFGELLASSIGGFVYVDANNNGIKEPGEAPIPNVTVTLTGTDDLGQAVNVVDQTDAAGAYLFENLRPGTYTITETQPAGFLDGKDTIGTPGGTTGQDVFSNIVLPQDFDGVNNNFGELLASSIGGFVYVDADNDGVKDPGDAPIPNVTVTLTGTDDLGQAVNVVDQTDAAGAYLFENLRPGTYTITETQPAGFLDGKDTIGTPGGTTGQDVFSNIVLPQDFDGVNNNFGELLASSIGGFVYVDANNNGVKEPGEAPIPNVTVTLTGTDDLGQAVNVVDQTDAAGAYLFENLRPGTYTITETQPAGFLDGKDTIGTPGGTTGQDVFSNIVLPQDFDGVNNNFGELLASSIGGFVYVDANNNGIKEPGEAPIPNVTVTLTGTDDLGQAVNVVDQTDAAGAYLFENLRPGTYTITETQPAGFLDGKDTIGTPGGTTGQDVFSNIVLPQDFDGVNNNFGELLASSIGGFVYVDADNDGVKDPGDAPIPNVTVTLTGTDDLGQAVNVVDQTDAAGAYLFENLRPGTYTITETQPAGFLDGKDTIGTPGGTTGQDVFSNIVLPQDFDGVNNNFGELLASSIGGFVYVDADNDGVKDPGDAPIPNVTVTLTGTDDLGQAVNVVDQTDAAGAYLFENLRPGTYTITETQPAGFLDGKDTIGTPGGTTGQDVFSNIVLPQDFDGVNNNFGELLPSSLSGFVYIDEEDDGQRGNNPGIPNVTITLTGTDDLGAAVNTVVQTDASGFYIFPNLRPGDYTITETQPAGFADGKDTIGTPGGTTGQDFFTDIILPQDFDGVENNFGELQAIPGGPSSLSGYVYVDANDNGIKEPNEFTIGNVTVTLTGTTNAGASVMLVTQTAVNGFYIFSNLDPGTYTITETQPNGFLDGKDTIGTPGGTTGQDVFSNIVLVAGFDGVNNNFGERGLSNPSKNLLLASTPVPPDLSNLGVVIGAPAGAVNNNGLVAQANSNSSGGGTNAAWFDAVYDDVLSRDPSTFEVNKQAGQLATGQTTHRDIAEDLLESRERKSKIIADLYDEYLGRAPDAPGLEFWLGIWDRFNGPERVQSGIIGSPEYYQTAGGTDQAWVGAMYQNILGRTAAQGEVSYHVNRLHQSGVNLQTIVLGFVYSDEYRSGLISDWYFDYLARSPEQGGVQYWLNQMKGGQSQESIQAGLLGSAEYRNKH